MVLTRVKVFIVAESSAGQLLEIVAHPATLPDRMEALLRRAPLGKRIQPLDTPSN